MPDKPQAFIETLQKHKFVESPISGVFVAFHLNKDTSVNIHYENGQIHIHAGGTGPKRITIDPIETDHIAIQIFDVEPLKIKEGKE